MRNFKILYSVDQSTKIALTCHSVRDFIGISYAVNTFVIMYPENVIVFRFLNHSSELKLELSADDVVDIVSLRKFLFDSFFQDGIQFFLCVKVFPF